VTKEFDERLKNALDHSAQVRELAGRLMMLTEHWCPEAFNDESFDNRMVRAFLVAAACCADQKRVLDGKQPLRPLDSYPDPMRGFDNSPTEFTLQEIVNHNTKNLIRRVR
jgi:hypothetical protein